jgi:hypothetical protein
MSGPEMRAELHAAMDHIVVCHETADESDHNDGRPSFGLRLCTRKSRAILSHSSKSRTNENERSD